MKAFLLMLAIGGGFVIGGAFWATWRCVSSAPGRMLATGGWTIVLAFFIALFVMLWEDVDEL